MSIEITCGCGKSYRVKDALAGRKVKCADCGAAISVPAVTVSPALNTETNTAATKVLTSEAGNQAFIRPQFLHFFKCYPSTILTMAGGLVLAAAVAAFGTFVIPFCFVVAAIRLLYSEIQDARSKFYWGDQNGGIVVSLNPPLVAVMANLTMTGQSYLPALKIWRQPLARMAGGPATLGMRLPTVAIYQRGKGDQIWEDFSPDVVNCVTTDPAVIEKSLRAIPEHEWEALENALDRLSNKQPGLYRMWEPNWQTNRQPLSTKHIWGNLAGIVVCLIFVAGAVVPVLIERAKIQNQNQNQPAIKAKE